MSIEIFYFPEGATKSDLARLLASLGYKKGKNLFFPGPKGTIHFFWSQKEDFKSTSGVDASIFPMDDKGKQVWKTNAEWGLHTRTSIWASSFDKEYQNLTVRQARREFGGKFYNDSCGINRYTVINKEPSTPASRGIFAAYTIAIEELDQLEYALPQDMIKKLTTPQAEYTDSNDPKNLLEAAQQLDPSRTIYNALIPFLVSALEYFFRETFEILLKYDNKAKAKLLLQNKKITINEAVSIAAKEQSLEDIVAKGYNFQNIESIHKAFLELFEIDFWQVIRRRKKVRDKLPLLSEALNNLITARHGVVHHFAVDRQLNREKFLTLAHTVKAIIKVFADEVEKKLCVTLGPG